MAPGARAAPRQDRDPCCKSYFAVVAIATTTSETYAVPWGRPKKMRSRLFTSESVRSEEHTSELQSLMRSSYAVFSLKTKHTINTQPHPTYHSTTRTHKSSLK